MRNIKYFLFTFIFSAIIAICFSCYTYYVFNTPYVKENTFFIVKKGNSFKNIINDLAMNNLIPVKSKLLFTCISKILYGDKLTIKAGEYEFFPSDTPYKILKKLENGQVLIRKITFAEGLSNDSILKIINSTYGLFGDIPYDELIEGTLLPETYNYTYGDSKKSIIERMQKAMINFLDKKWEERDCNLPFETKQEALNLASIVEKETGLSNERRKVASVFINRLKRGMRLQSDPTVIYSFTKGNKDLEREIRKSDLARISEYNTYRINGIPKKAIANPGKDAIESVLKPEKTDYLYFVATGNGGHNFSTTLKEHNKFVRQYREEIKKITEDAKTN